MSRQAAAWKKSRLRAGKMPIITSDCWPSDETGYKNLVKLATAAHLEGLLLQAAHRQGNTGRAQGRLIALSGCLASEIPDIDYQRINWTRRARRLIGSSKRSARRIFISNCKTTASPEQVKVNRHLIPWAKEFGLKLVATNDVHYVEKAHSHAHDCLICIGTQTLLSDTKTDALPAGAVLFALGRGNEGALQRNAGSGAQHAGSGGEMQRRNRVQQTALPGVSRRRRSRRAKATCASCWRRGWTSATAIHARVRRARFCR